MNKGNDFWKKRNAQRSVDRKSKFNMLFESIMNGVDAFPSVEPDMLSIYINPKLKLIVEDICKDHYVVSKTTGEAFLLEDVLEWDRRRLISEGIGIDSVISYVKSIPSKIYDGLLEVLSKSVEEIKGFCEKIRNSKIVKWLIEKFKLANTFTEATLKKYFKVNGKTDLANEDTYHATTRADDTNPIIVVDVPGLKKQMVIAVRDLVGETPTNEPDLIEGEPQKALPGERRQLGPHKEAGIGAISKTTPRPTPAPAPSPSGDSASKAIRDAKRYEPTDDIRPAPADSAAKAMADAKRPEPAKEEEKENGVIAWLRRHDDLFKKIAYALLLLLLILGLIALLSSLWPAVAASAASIGGGKAILYGTGAGTLLTILMIDKNRKFIKQHWLVLIFLALSLFQAIGGGDAAARQMQRTIKDHPSIVRVEKSDKKGGAGEEEKKKAEKPDDGGSGGGEEERMENDTEGDEGDWDGGGMEDADGGMDGGFEDADSMEGQSGADATSNADSNANTNGQGNGDSASQSNGNWFSKTLNYLKSHDATRPGGSRSNVRERHIPHGNGGGGR